MAGKSKTVATPVLSMFLVKEGVSQEELLEESHSPTATPIQVGQVKGLLYTQSSPPRPPAWASFFGTAVNAATLALQTASASALLVVPMNNRTFALSFGYGRHLINPMAVEASFGLRVTLNSVPTDGIRSIDKKTFEGISTHTREQASKDTSIGDFGLNVERDVVRAVAGTPSDVTLGSRLMGMDALTAQCKVSLEELPELLQVYLAKSQETTYKKRFPWIDNILEVRDKVRRSQLDAILVKVLRSGGNPRTWLAVPELIDWADVDGFSYSLAKSADVFPDVHLKDYIAYFSSESISEQSLKRHRVFGRSATTGSVFGAWPVYRCVQAEITIDGETYLLNGGEWYRVDKDFVALVDATINAIPSSDMATLEYHDGENEAQYNERLSKAIAGASCLDRQLIQYGGGKSSIEFCDVYHPSGHMIHVKRYAGSSVLSHLFAQGTVSATAFISDEKFRREVNKLLPAASRIKTPGKKPIAGEFEVAFVIASRSAGALSLPFFSRVTLRNAYTQLTNYGFRTTVTKVQVI